MVRESHFREVAQRSGDGGNFEEAARAHLRSLEEAGETPEQIVGQLSDVATSYANEGLQDEARVLREIIRQYQMGWVNVGATSVLN